MFQKYETDFMELDGIRYKGRGAWFPRRFWWNWRTNRAQKKAERERWSPLEEWKPSSRPDDDT